VHVAPLGEGYRRPCRLVSSDALLVRFSACCWVRNLDMGSNGDYLLFPQCKLRGIPAQIDMDGTYKSTDAGPHGDAWSVGKGLKASGLTKTSKMERLPLTPNGSKLRQSTTSSTDAMNASAARYSPPSHQTASFVVFAWVTGLRLLSQMSRVIAYTLATLLANPWPTDRRFDGSFLHGWRGWENQRSFCASYVRRVQGRSLELSVKVYQGECEDGLVSRVSVFAADSWEVFERLL